MKLLFFKKILIGCLLGLISVTVLLFILSAILSTGEDPIANLSLFSQIPLIVGSIVAGKVSTLGLQSKLLQGLLTGMIFALILIIPSAIISSFTSLSALRIVCTVIFAIAGAFIGKKHPKLSSTNARRKAVIKRYAR